MFTGRYEPIQWSALTYIRRTAVGNAVDMACSLLIDLSFCVAKEGIYKEEPSVFESRHEFFNSEPYTFRPCKKYHTCIILMLILIRMIVITFIIRKYVKVVLDSS